MLATARHKDIFRVLKHWGQPHLIFKDSKVGATTEDALMPHS